MQGRFPQTHPSAFARLPLPHQGGDGGAISAGAASGGMKSGDAHVTVNESDLRIDKTSDKAMGQ